MAFSKIIFNGTTLMDVTQTTAIDSDVNYQKVYTKADGIQSTGTNQGIVDILFQQDENGYIVMPEGTYGTATGVSF